MKWKLEEAFQRLNKHAGEDVSTFLIQGDPAFLYLNAKEEQKLQDVFYFFREENLVHIEPIDDHSRRGLQAHVVLEAIPLPRLIQVWEEAEPS
ncbi:hypothetical protein [Marinococcus halophilus]|uniref:hypothetical protein n=1 Tax=Marinococcus halophilus TaxID=1371 RepID=UPI0009A8C84B|nr:hypothetical protein [Marinococcus halophilus]